jgi:hypothetical protein
MIFKVLRDTLSNMSLTEQLNQVVNKAINEYIHKISTDFNLPEDRLQSLWQDNNTTTTKPVGSTQAKLTQTKLVANSSTATGHLNKMSRAELVELCRTKNLSVSGTKELLISRLSGEEKEKPVTKAKSKGGKKTPDPPAVVNKIIKQHVNNIGIKRNKFNNYEHMDTKLLFDETTQKVYGKQNYQTGQIDMLTSEDIETCQMYKFPFIIPENLDQANAAEDDEEETIVDDVDVEDEIEVEVDCDLEEDDLEEDLEEEVEYEYE